MHFAFLFVLLWNQSTLIEEGTKIKYCPMFIDRVLCIGGYTFTLGTIFWAYTNSVLYVSNRMLYISYDFGFDSLNSLKIREWKSF
jgi:hypothetical protein